MTPKRPNPRIAGAYTFDELAALSKEDPERFKELGESLVENTITALPVERQLRARQFQWKIQGILAKYKNPLVRAQKLTELLKELQIEHAKQWFRLVDSVERLLNDAQDLLEKCAALDKKTKEVLSCISGK